MYHAPDQRRALEPPLHFFVGYLKEAQRVRIHLNHCDTFFYEGTFMGFDEFMNIVLGKAEEIYIKGGLRVPLGTTMLRGETIAIVHGIGPTPA